ERVFVADLAGVVYQGRRELMDPHKARYAQETPARQLAEIIGDADVFLGLSAGGVLNPEMVARMAPRPLILALANPEPEVRPEAASRPARSPICGPTATGWRASSTIPARSCSRSSLPRPGRAGASSTPKARTSGYCARRRSRSTRSSPARC